MSTRSDFGCDLIEVKLHSFGVAWSAARGTGAEAVKLRGGCCAGRFGLRGRPASGCRPRANLSVAARSADRCGGVCGGSGRAWAARGNGGGPGCIGNRAWPRHSRAHCRNGSQGVCISDYQGAGSTMIPLPTGLRVQRRWDRHVAPCQTAGARQIYLAVGHGRRRFDFGVTARLQAGSVKRPSGWCQVRAHRPARRSGHAGGAAGFGPRCGEPWSCRFGRRDAWNQRR